MSAKETNKSSSQDEILSKTKSVVQTLNSLKTDHLQMLTHLKMSNEDDKFVKNHDNNKVDLLSKTVERIELGLGEAQVGSQSTQI